MATENGKGDERGELFTRAYRKSERGNFNRQGPLFAESKEVIEMLTWFMETHDIRNKAHLARLLGVTYGSVCKWLAGKHRLSSQAATRLFLLHIQATEYGLELVNTHSFNWGTGTYTVTRGSARNPALEKMHRRRTNRRRRHFSDDQPQPFAGDDMFRDSQFEDEASWMTD